MSTQILRERLLRWTLRNRRLYRGLELGWVGKVTGVVAASRIGVGGGGEYFLSHVQIIRKSSKTATYVFLALCLFSVEDSFADDVHCILCTHSNIVTTRRTTK
jgi:hypothetical protein